MIGARPRIKAKILDGMAIQQALVRMAHQILDRNPHLDQVAMLGISERGELLAKRLASIFKSTEGTVVPATLLSPGCFSETLAGYRTIVLVDDIINTGREAHRAIERLLNEKAVNCIQLAVLVDRGNRELPVHPDYVGKNVPTTSDESVEVRLKELDKDEQVLIMENSLKCLS